MRTRPQLRPVRWAVRVLCALLTVAALAAPASAATETFQPDRWSPPSATRTAAFATTDIGWTDGVHTTTVIPDDELPLRMVVEKELLDRLDVAGIRAGVEAWNTIRGSRFRATLDGVADTRIRRAAVDGVHRIFLLGSCNGDELAWAHVNQVRPDERYGARSGFTTDADIGICPRLLDAPGKVMTTIRHEVGHLMGQAHVDEPCRVMSAVNGNCDRMTQGEHDAARYLYPTMPRLAGPTRLESSARSTYAGWSTSGTAGTVVLVDGFGGSELPVVAAAYAGAINAPLMLADGSCTSAAAGTELRRLAARAATVALVGRSMERCASDVTALGMRPLLLPDAAAVAGQIAAKRAVDTVVVVRGALPDGNLPDGLTAAAVAGRLGAPILLTEGEELAPWAQAFVRTHRSRLDRAIIVGGTKAVSTRTETALQGAGMTTERRGGTDRIATALAVSETPGAFAPRSPVLVVAADKWADAVSGSALGAARGWPVVLTYATTLDPRVAQFVTRRGTGGYVVGGRAAISDAVHVQISSALGA